MVERGGDGLGRRRAHRDRLRGGDPGARHCDGGEADGGDYSEDAVRAAAEGLGASLDPPGDVHGSADYRRHLAEVAAVRAVLEGGVQEERSVVAAEPTASRAIGIEVNGERYERDVSARKPPRALHPRRPRPHGDAHRLRHGELRRVHGDRRRQPVKSCMLLAVQADGASVADGRGPRAGRGADAAPALVQRAPRAPVRLLHARDAHERDRAARAQPAADRGGRRYALQGNICRCTGY